MDIFFHLHLIDAIFGEYSRHRCLHCSSIYSNLFSLPLFVQKAEETLDPIELSLVSVFTTWSFIIIFFFCESGERLSGKFEAIDDELYECDWYLFPMEIQRMVLILLSGTHAPVLLRGFGNIVCTREAFKDVRFESYKKKIKMTFFYRFKKIFLIE